MGLFSGKGERVRLGAGAMAAGRSEAMSRKGRGLGFGEWLDRMGGGGLTSGGGWSAQEMRGYRSLRACVPIVDAAVSRLVRLCGGVGVRCGDPGAQAGLEEFFRTVDVGWGQRGVQAFLDRYLDDLFTCGHGLGEIVLDLEGKEIAALLCADPGQVEAEIGAGSPPDAVSCCGLRNGACPYWLYLLMRTTRLPLAAIPPSSSTVNRRGILLAAWVSAIF